MIDPHKIHASVTMLYRGIGEREGRVTRDNIRYARGGWGGVLPPHVGMVGVLPSNGITIEIRARKNPPILVRGIEN